MSRTNATILGPSTTPLCKSDLPEQWKYNLSYLTVKTTVPRLSTDECDIVKKSLTLAMIVDRYPTYIWSHMYTDGSASAAIKEGGV